MRTDRGDMRRVARRGAWAALLLLAAATAVSAADDAAPRTEADIPIPIDERGIRAAGIATVPIERERGGTDLSLPGTVAIPQQQIRVVAAPAGGLVEEMLVAADEPVQAGQPIAQLRSPAIVEAQRQFPRRHRRRRARRSTGCAAANCCSKARRAARSATCALPKRKRAQAKSRLDERTQILSLMGMTDREVETLRKTRRIFPTVTVSLADRRHRHRAARQPRRARRGGGADLHDRRSRAAVGQHPGAGGAAVEPLDRRAGDAAGARRQGPDHPHRPHRRSRDPIGHRRRRNRLQQRHGASGSRGRRHGARRRRTTAANGPSRPPAVVRHRDRSWVFVRSKDGFRARPVQVIAEIRARRVDPRRI